MQMCNVMNHILISLITEHGIACSCSLFLYTCHFLSIRNRKILMVEDEVVGISRSTLLGFLMMTEILKVRRLDSGAESTHTYAQKHYSLTYQEAEIVTSELVQLFIMAWPHWRSDGSASCETYAHTGICDPSAHSESWGSFIKRWRH